MYGNPMNYNGMQGCMSCGGMGYLMMNGMQQPCGACSINVNNNYGGMGMGGMAMGGCMGCGGMGYSMINGFRQPCGTCSVNINNNYAGYGGMGMGGGVGGAIGGLVGGLMNAICGNCNGSGYYNGMRCNCMF